MGFEDGPRCLLSHPTQPSHNLSSRYRFNFRIGCFTCGGKAAATTPDCLYYYCSTCEVTFHNGCHKRPRRITHPYHLQHPLTLFYRNPETGTISNIIPDACPGKVMDTSDPGKYEYVDIIPSKSDIVFNKCTWCVRDFKDLPRVIKITRHSHRLSLTPHYSPLLSSCRICYKEVDIKYGLYTCNHQDCFYVAHSKCATHENVWDGTELEWETDESDDTDDIAPFRMLGDGSIKHFCHKHRLKLKKHDGVRDTEKQCRACIYPIVSHQFYHCKKCNYSLHEVCASLSQKLDHALHNHTLILAPSPGYMCCSACSRDSTGFKYICSKKDCKDFVLDVRCITVPECFNHRSHEHPIFISTSYNMKDEILCKICKKRCLGAHLQCTRCDFTMCYSCATIPDEIHYRFDKHPLTLSCGENVDVMYWCEVCEKQLHPREWFYTCDKCCTTIHLQCIFGSSVFMRPGSIFRDYRGKVQVFRNNSNTRKLCYICHNRCTGLVYYEGYRQNGMSYYDYIKRPTLNMVFCSLECEKIGMRKRHLIRLPR